MKKPSIKMIYDKHMPSGQGVLSACREQVALVKKHLGESWTILENSARAADIYHYHTINFTFSFSLLWHKICRRKTICYVHFVPKTLKDSIRLNPLFRACFFWYMVRFYAGCDRLVVVNPDFARELEALGVKREKITYIPNFVTKNDFYPASERPERFTVVCAGQLQTRKGVFDFARLAEALPELDFVWAGGFSFGKITDGYEEISELLKNHPPNLGFAGMLEREEMNGFLQGGSVFLLPSYSELFPMTILEAFNVGLPVVLRDLEEYKSIVADYTTACADNEAFAAELRRLANDEEYYATAAAASAAGGEYYSEERIAKLWEEFYASFNINK